MNHNVSALMRKSLWISASGLAVSIVVAAMVAFLLRANGPGSREESDEPGVSYIHKTDPTVPWSISIVKVDRSRKDLTFFAPLARNQVLGISRLYDQVWY